MTADWSSLAPFMIEGHPPMWISRAAMADPDAAQPYEFEDKLYWVEAPADFTIEDMQVVSHERNMQALVTKSRALVSLLDDAEVNHGGLWSGKTMRARDDLRQELARWGSGK